MQDKACKPNNKKRGKPCKSCGERFIPVRPLQKICMNNLCAIKHIEELRMKRDRKETRERKAKLKTRRDWLREAQCAFNRFIRIRDKLAGYSCISSGKPLDWSGNNVDAGHYRSTGAAPHLRFNEDNCHAQSKKDNRWLSGNAVDYRIGLISRIGIDAVEALEADNTTKKYTTDDLKAIKADYTRKAKELEKA